MLEITRRNGVHTCLEQRSVYYNNLTIQIFLMRNE